MSSTRSDTKASENTASGDAAPERGASSRSTANGATANNAAPQQSARPRKGGRAAVGHPVDVASGVMFSQTQDMAIAGLIPLLLERHYSTAFLAADRGPLGPGWRLGFAHELRQDVDGYTYTAPNGAEYYFDNVDNALERTGRIVLAGDGLELRRVSPDVLSLVGFRSARSGVELHFRRREGSVHYRMISAVRNARARLDFGYDDHGRLIRVRQLREQRALHLTYDDQGRLNEVHLRGHDGELEWLAARYSYDDAGYLSEVLDDAGVRYRYEYREDGRMRTEARRSGVVYTFDYDGDGRCVHATGQNRYQERWLAYDPLGRVTEVTDSHGEVSVYEYNSAGQIIELRSPTGNKTTLEYDDQGLLTAQGTPTGATIGLEYDVSGRQTAFVQPDGRPVTFEYDAHHRPIAHTGAGGYRIEMDYSDDHALSAIRLPNGQTWRYDYNAWGELTAIRFPDGTAELREYDARGGVVGLVDRSGQRYRFTHNALGQVASQTDPLGNVTRYEYDQRHRPARLTTPDGRWSTFEYDDGAGLFVETRSDGARRHRRYNPCGQPLEMSDFDGRVVRYEWDTEPCRLRKITSAHGATYEIDYDGDGYPIRRKLWDDTTVLQEWDGGLLSAVVDPNGTRFAYEHDGLDRLVRRIAPEGETLYEYDTQHSLLSKITSPSSELSFERNDQGLVVRELQDGFEIKREYDTFGRALRSESELGHVTSFDYDPLGACLAIHDSGGTVRFERDALGRETKRLLPNGGAFEQQLDPMGRVLSQSYRPPLSLQSSDGSDLGPHAFQRTLQYDAAGNLSAISDSLRGNRQLFHSPNGRLLGSVPDVGPAEFFGYDENDNQLWAASIPDGVHFTESHYDPLRPDTFQQLQQVAQTQAVQGNGAVMTYGQSNRLLSREEGARKTDYEYDSAGFLLKKTEHPRGEAPRTWRYHWNSIGQLVTLERPDGERWEYVYDGVGRRIRKVGPDGETRYVWDETRLIYEIKGDEVVRYVYDPTTDTVALRHDGRAHYVLCDHSASPSEVVDQAGVLEPPVTRETWGWRPHQRAIASGFWNQWYDEESGLYYNFYRYYDAEIGRYISPDPIDLEGGFNPYRYTTSPEMFADPLGLMPSNRYPGPYFNDGNVPDLSNASGVDRPGATMDDTNLSRDVVNPSSNTRRGSVSTNQDPNSVRSSNSTVTRVYDGNSDDPVFSTLNGRVAGDPSAGTPRQTRVSGHGTMEGGVSRSTWWHAEQWALSLAIRNPSWFAGGDGPIRIDISRPSCSRCSPTLGPLAARLATETGRRVVITWPGQDENNPFVRNPGDTC